MEMHGLIAGIRVIIRRCLPGALLMLAFTFIMSSCGKDNIFDLFQSSGPIVKEQRELSGYFDKISLFNNVNLVLTQGPTTGISVEGGRNLLSDITTEIGSDSTLTIRNLNNYNWVRSYDKEITVYLQVNRLRVIRYESTGDITTTDTIHQDSLRVDAWGGSGTINMTIDCGTSWLTLQYGSMDFNISGRCVVTYIFAGSYGPFHCLGLQSHNTFIINSGTNDCYANAIDRIDADIRSIGNIYYSGDPPIVNSNVTGTGQLIHLR
jgi:hypothetical protein